MENWHGYKAEKFEFEGREAIIVFPNTERNGSWGLKTEYWDAFPDTELTMLSRGYHIAWVKNISRFATREDYDIKARFVKYISKKYGLKNKCIPVGMSCGGAHAVQFAGYYPKCVECMFIDAPVLNFLSYPGKLSAGQEGIWENEFRVAYPDMERYMLFGSDIHPICRVKTLIENKIPIIMLYGTEDKTVIYEENGALFEGAYKDHPELLKVMPISLRGHHPHGKTCGGNGEIVDFIDAHTGNGKAEADD